MAGPGDSSSWVKFNIERVVHKDPEVVIYRFTGTLSDTKQVYEFVEVFRKDVCGGEAPMILDLSNVDHATSSGVGLIAACFNSATNAKRKFCLTGLTRRVTAVMSAIRFLSVVDHYDTEEEGVRKISG